MKDILRGLNAAVSPEYDALFYSAVRMADGFKNALLKVLSEGRSPYQTFAGSVDGIVRYNMVMELEEKFSQTAYMFDGVMTPGWVQDPNVKISINSFKKNNVMLEWFGRIDFSVEEKTDWNRPSVFNAVRRASPFEESMGLLKSQIVCNLRTLLEIRLEMLSLGYSDPDHDFKFSRELVPGKSVSYELTWQCDGHGRDCKIGGHVTRFIRTLGNPGNFVNEVVKSEKRREYRENGIEASFDEVLARMPENLRARLVEDGD